MPEFYAHEAMTETPCTAYLSIVPDNLPAEARGEEVYEAMIPCTSGLGHIGRHQFHRTVSAAKNVHIEWED